MGRFASIAVAAALLVGLLVLGGAAFVWSGTYNVAATAGHTPLVTWLLETVQERSVAVRARDLPEPPAMDSSQLAHGFEHFDAMCVMCHGAPGVERTEVGKGITPTPPDLSEEAEEYTARELFWITKHGIKLAGMPGFGITHSDEQLWGIVAFVQQLPGMSPGEYGEWRASIAAPADSGQASSGGHSHAPGTPAHGH